MDVRPASGFRSILAFEDGQQRELDVARVIMFSGVFEPLAEPAFLRQVEVNSESGTIVWPNGADLAPETLLNESRPLVRPGL